MMTGDSRAATWNGRAEKLLADIAAKKGRYGGGLQGGPINSVAGRLRQDRGVF